jgi:hypothetical protein
MDLFMGHCDIHKAQRSTPFQYLYSLGPVYTTGIWEFSIYQFFSVSAPLLSENLESKKCRNNYRFLCSNCFWHTLLNILQNPQIHFPTNISRWFHLNSFPTQSNLLTPNFSTPPSQISTLSHTLLDGAAEIGPQLAKLEDGTVLNLEVGRCPS